MSKLTNILQLERHKIAKRFMKSRDQVEHSRVTCLTRARETTWWHVTSHMHTRVYVDHPGERFWSYLVVWRALHACENSYPSRGSCLMTFAWTFLSINCVIRHAEEHSQEHISKKKGETWNLPPHVLRLNFAWLCVTIGLCSALTNI